MHILMKTQKLSDDRFLNMIVNNRLSKNLDRHSLIKVIDQSRSILRKISNKFEPRGKMDSILSTDSKLI